MDKKEIEKKITLALDELRPFLKDDGGDVEFVNINSSNEISLRLIGACKDCSMSKTTTAGIKNAIKQAVPEVNEINILLS